MQGSNKKHPGWGKKRQGDKNIDEIKFFLINNYTKEDRQVTISMKRFDA